jgi:D-sedoheptulose 7-phosphate isomerase
MNFQSIISSHITEHLSMVEKLRDEAPFIEDLARRVLECLDAGGKVFFFGNGGSAADAQHLATEFVVRFRQNRKALPALALHTDTSVMTACANDFGFETVYARQIEALANAGDVAFGISTSGSSANVINGLEAAKAKSCLTVAFTAEGGGECARVADLAFRAPTPVTARAQECHLLAGHILCDLVEETFVQREK